MSVKVSIIVPVYNAENFIEKTAKSLMKQTCQDLELIFVEDGSEDGSYERLEALARKDERIRILRQENQGTAKARNAGIRMAQGTYVMFMDDDDWVPNSYVEEYVEAADRMEADIVIGGYRRVSQSGVVLEKRRIARGELVVYGDDWRRFILIAPWAKIYRRDFVVRAGAEFLDYPYGEDIYFQTMLYALHPKVGYIDTVSYAWVYREDSVSNTLHKGIREESVIFPMMEELLKVYPYRDEYFRYFLIRHCARHLYFSAADARPEEIREEFKRCRSWLSGHGIRMPFSPFSKKLEGEKLRDRAAVAAVWLAGTLHMEGIFARLVCRGGRE